MNFDARAIAAATGGTLLAEGPHGPVATDTRNFPAGGWFVALSGARFDGHDHLGSLVGAAGAVVSRPPGAGWTAGAVLVADTLRALQDLGAAARRSTPASVVAITGSAGKTTTRALTALALRPLGPVHQTQGNLNNHIGVPLTLLAAPADAQTWVIEMGTSSPGEIQRLAEIATPDVRLIVNVGPAHLEELGGLDGVALEKGALFRTARPGDWLAVAVDDPYVAVVPRPLGTNIVTWGRSSGADVALSDIAFEPAAGALVAQWNVRGRRVRARLPTLSDAVAIDAAGALAIALALDVSPADAADALSDYAPVGSRMRSEPLPRGATAWNDTYNANPTSVSAALAALARMPGRRAAVLGDMLELGPDEATWHHRAVDEARSLGLDHLAFVGPRMANAAGAKDGWADPLDAVGPLAAWVEPGDVILFKGSRGARVERVLDALRTALEGS